MLKPNLILVRGLPGSGKSTIAQKYAAYSPDTLVHLEADMYFMVMGKYVFNKDLLHEAHKWCLEKTIAYLKEGKSVIVANTFTTYKEMRPYVNLFPEYCSSLQAWVATGNYGSIHNVPEETIAKMKARWQE